MRQDGLPPQEKPATWPIISARLITHINLKHLAGSQSKFLRENKPVSRRIICLKLIGCLETATNEDDASHYRELLTLLFRQ
ncbi:hypothetical protein [Pantoea sp. SGAir0215]